MKKIGARELRAKLEAGEMLELVDIREADEYSDWHIQGSRNLPVYDALKEDDEEPLTRGSEALPRDRSIVTVCRGGILSERAGRLLESLGFEVLSLDGGMREWGQVWSVATIPTESPGRMQAFQVRRDGKGCLSYVFGAEGRAAVVDPSVEIEAYLETAHEAGLEITHVIETHVHADHLSRARELCRLTSAELVLPKNERVAYAHTPIEDGGKISVGPVEVEAISTPGHTSESTCYLLDETILLSGDTLLVHGVGRPDLEQGAVDGARRLYHSIREKLIRRFDDIPFYPGHHRDAIGFDGAPIGSSIAQVRRGMKLIQADEDEFVNTIVEHLGAKPANFEAIIAINEGRAILGDRDAAEIEAGPNSCTVG